MASMDFHCIVFYHISRLLKNLKDYIILGAGASGLMLAYRMSKDPFFDDKSILIIDKTKDKGNDRTWCFWEKENGEWDAILTKEWSSIVFKSDTVNLKADIEPYHYKMLRSEDYYKRIWAQLDAKSNIEFVHAEVQDFKENKNEVEVATDKGPFSGRRLFSSVLLNSNFKTQSKYPVLQQHFIGWFVETSSDSFDDSAATFMDFKIDQSGNTRFMYVLPTSKKKALFEYTLFSADILPKSEYEEAITQYLKNRGILEFKIVERESGAIPMTCFPFSESNTANLMYIGTAGGWTKPSTGYTFSATNKKTKTLVQFLKTGKGFEAFENKSRFWFYDLLMIDVLYKHNHLGSKLFSGMFKNLKTQILLKFLDEETSITQDIKLMSTVPKGLFTKALLKRLF